MKKLALMLVAVAVVGALIALLMLQSGPSGGAGPAGPAVAKPEDLPAASTPAKAPDAARKPRARAQTDEAAAVLAVAGTVRTADGKPLAGATVDAFAVPASDDVSDEERIGREFLTRTFGKSTADRLGGRGKKLIDAVGSGDSSRMGDAMSDGMEITRDLIADEGSLDAITALMRMGRDVFVADDGAWEKAGSAATGADGTFRIEGLAAGRIELRAKAPSHVRSKTRVAAGDVNVSMQLARGVRLAGVVTCTKEPVTGASVIIKGAQATTGAGGRFEFDAARAPSETLIVSADGCVAQGQTVALLLDGPNKDLAIELDPAGAAAGHVSSAAGGPIAGARVVLAGSGNLFSEMMGMGAGGGRFDVPPPPATTGADGAFEMRGVRTGAAKLRVDAEGYLGATVSIDVKRGQTAQVEALLLRESVLTGSVRDAKGAAVAGAKVRVEVPARDAATGMVAQMMGGTFKSAVADEKGRFEVHGLTEGERKVRVEAAKFLTLEDKIDIPAQSAATHDYVLREGLRLAGTVAGPDGKPVAGAKIFASGKTAPGGMGGMAAMFGGGRAKVAVAESGADGKWTADGLQEGPYTVTATADGYLDGEEKSVGEGRTDVVLRLGAAATIRGRVLGLADMKPLAGATVQRKSAGAAGGRGGRGGGRGGGNPFAAMMGGGGATVTCDKDGAFEIKGLEAGGYDLTGLLKGFADSEAKQVTCIAGEVLDGVEIVLAPGVAVSGRVVEKNNGAGVEGAVVWAVKADNAFGGFAMSDAAGGAPQAPANSINTRTDADGHFVLEGLSPGKVNVEVRVADHAPSSASGVTAPSTEILVQVSGGGNVEGRVTGADGAGVAGAQITIMRGMMGQGARQARSDVNGDFRIERLPAGSWQIMLMDSASPMPSGMAQVAVKDGETARHDFTKKTGGRQFGGAASKDGKPLANVPIMLMGGSAGMKMATSDEKGHFSFDGLDPGDYTVLVQSSFMGGGSTSRKVTVGADGKVEDVNLELSSAKIEGDILDADTGKGVSGAQIALSEIGGKTATGEDIIGSFRGQAMTDERGHFVISDVQTGSFSLKASAAEYSTVSVNGVASGSRAVQVQMHRGVEFPVTVVGPDNLPVANATVQPVDAAGNTLMDFGPGMRSFTRADGVARLRLAPGRYTIKVTAADLLPAQADVDTESGGATVHLDAGATLDVLATTDGTTAAPGARVKVLDAAGVEVKPGLTIASFMGGNDRTGADGKFTRPGLPAGAVTVIVTDAAGHEARTDTTLEMNRTRHVDVIVK